MRAARFAGDGAIAVVDEERPRAGPGDALVETLGCALCGSDLRPWRSGWPVTPGHEIVGRVASPGHPLEGRRVVVYIPIFCDACEACARGDTHVCPNATDLVGWQRDGGYAEALVVPDRCLVPVPDDIPTRLAPLALDTIATVMHGLRRAATLVGTGPALVVGAGPIGLGAILAAQALGYEQVFFSEPNTHRAAAAERLSARPMAEGPERFTLVVEASGKDAGRQTALERVASGGAVVQLGESDSWTIAENKAIRRKDFMILRSFYFPLRDLAPAFETLRADRARYETLVDEIAPLEDLPDLFGRFARGERLKPVVAFPGADTP